MLADASQRSAQMPALAAALRCIAIAVADGDTLTACCDGPGRVVHVTVRVAETDGPAKARPWGSRSKQHLAALCFPQPAVLRPCTTDHYGRTVACVECDGIDASRAAGLTGRRRAVGAAGLASSGVIELSVESKKG
jgi:endonuclease YncB( thermonuclease family)